MHNLFWKKSAMIEQTLNIIHGINAHSRHCHCFPVPVSKRVLNKTWQQKNVSFMVRVKRKIDILAKMSRIVFKLLISLPWSGESYKNDIQLLSIWSCNCRDVRHRRKIIESKTGFCCWPGDRTQQSGFQERSPMLFQNSCSSSVVLAHLSNSSV